MNRTNPIPGIFLASLCSLAFATQLNAQNTDFTYQGRLNESGIPANGVYDFTFQAFDAPSSGNSIGGTINLNAVEVTGGLFTALVDLGDSPFTGPARWLQISVSTNGAGNFTALVPRQPLTPSPYAIFAHTAGTVTNGAITAARLAVNSIANGNIQDNAVSAGKISSGQVVKSLNGLTDGVSLTQGANVTIDTVGNSLQISAPAGGLNLPFSGSASSSGSIFTLGNSGAGPAGAFLGNVGIGTTTPQAGLHVRTPGEGVRIQGQSGGVANTAYLSFVNGVGTRIGYVGDGGSSDDAVYLNADSGNVYLHTAVGAVLTATAGGNVGIGTVTPAAKLEVRGDIRLGPSGQFRAASGEENLRIVRGTVNGDGTVLRGAGFTITHLSEGDYRINFTTAFSAAPTVTSTVDEEFEVFDDTEFLVAGIITPSTSSVRVRIRRHSASSAQLGPADWRFHFIAIGPH